ncbi:hypothetical protein A3K42_01390 [candidate division WWE3 bacterium RBG_13_37_7]|uniref:Uncharacterized protein n=1 Tax=candidate division WWE3 bacterium RBG_13_37_7 TaxID=1802609 RepID=A0A1F4U0J6_UNCKA|nr:MAG: hypothetical protein A3K42_01390 [candidate division WWE3 bacterium RBG_13_37_7]
MFFIVTGGDMRIALDLMRKALPILRKYDAPVNEKNTVSNLPDSKVVDGDGNIIAGASSLTFYFPAFDKLQKNVNLETLAKELADSLGCPCHTLKAEVIAGFSPQ